jgi:hypothetical protein
MKFSFKKVASVLASAVMLSSTIGFASAASYPAPFVVNGNPDGAIIVGSSNAVAPTDWAAAVEISTDLSGRVSSTESETAVSGGDAKSLASGSDLVYLNDDLAENVETVTDSDLATVLADGTFTDDDGTDYDYEQTISVGTSTNNGLAFTDSGNDLNNPEVLLQLTSSSSTPAYTLTANFDSAVPFNATASEGEVITLFGREYTVGTATDGDTLVLLGGASETTVNVGESATVEVGGESYEVALNAISDATSAQSSITINGDTKTFTEGQTKKVSGIDVFAKTVFRSGDNAGYVIVQLGSDKLTFENGNAVQYGTDNEDIEGTLVTITGGVNAMTKLQVGVSADDSDNDHVLEGESFLDPVFGTVSLDFVELKNGPMLNVEADEGTTRKMLEVTSEGDNELGLSVETPGNNAKTLPFVYENALTDEDGNVIHVVEGDTLVDDSYFILNSGNYEYYMQMTKVALAAADSDVHFKNVITGTTYTDKGVNNDDDINQTAGTTTTFTIDSQTFTVTSVNASAVTITSSDFSTNKAVFPYLELVDGKDTRVAITDEVLAFDDATPASNKTMDLPSGTVAVTFGNSAANGDCSVAFAVTGGSTYTLAVNGTVGETEDGITVGTVDYVVGVNETGTAEDGVCDAIDVMIGLESTQTVDGTTEETDPAILFVEEEDKTETTADTKNAVVIPTTDDGSYNEAATPVFTGTSDNDGFDDTDYTGYVTNFGTYVLKNSKDSDQTVVSLTYSANQMYGEIFISETGASITPGASGSGGSISVFKDTQVNSVSGKNLIIVGGSCINSAAAKILDSEVPICGADFTEKTGVGPSQYLIKVVESPWNSDKVAMLVAGYEATDTLNAKNVVLEGVTTDVGTDDVLPQLGTK